MREVFVEQPLALPGSAKYQFMGILYCFIIFCFVYQAQKIPGNPYLISFKSTNFK